ncbi:MAG: hypothetical protein ACLQGP_23030 [Isosphaeraceae bacterium]
MKRISACALILSSMILPALGLAGCGQSSEVMEIPEAARKSVLQKKVDDQPRTSRASKARQGYPKGR